MTNVKEAIVLCAGNSTRFGEKNKLYQNINGHTLPQHIIEFCVKNEIKRINFTINKNDLYFNGAGDTILNPIMSSNYFYVIDKKLRDKVKIRYEFQNENEYGPAAAIKPWLESNLVKSDFIVLFGDNYYNGILPKFDFESVDAYASYRTLENDPRNLKYAAIINDFIIEKPHSFIGGNFFCGYLAFSRRVNIENNIKKIKISGRNEYEISDFFNIAKTRKIIYNDLIWSDITIEDDIQKVKNLIKNNKELPKLIKGIDLIV